jgi:protein-tyrosine-phosphatase
MADAGLAVRLGLDEAEEPEPRRVGERPEDARQLVRLLAAEGLLEERGTARCDRGDGFHPVKDIDRDRCLRQDRGVHVPEVLFVCVHNAGRSQMAAGLMSYRSAGKVHVRSAGSDPAEEVNPAVVEAMAELGIDLGDELPKLLTDEAVRAADAVITMGCGDACPVYPGKRYLDWELPDPAGQDLATVRAIRDEIDARVQTLLAELLEEDG